MVRFLRYGEPAKFSRCRRELFRDDFDDFLSQVCQAEREIRNASRIFRWFCIVHWLLVMGISRWSKIAASRIFCFVSNGIAFEMYSQLCRVRKVNVQRIANDDR